MDTNTETTTAVVTATEAPEVKTPVHTPAIPKNEELSIEGIDPSKMGYYKGIAKCLDEHDMGTILNYGTDLQKAMGNYTNDFLNQQFASRSSVESAALISNLLGELQEIDLDDFDSPSALKRWIRKIPILKKMVVSVAQLQAKYNTIEKNIDGIVAKLEATKAIALRDNNLLQIQMENNMEYVKQLEDIILAGRLKSDDLKKKILKHTAVGANEYDEFEAAKLKDFVTALDKRLTDLTLLRYAFKQSLVQIRIIQSTNMMDITNTESQISLTIPLWKNQLSLAVALFNQKQSLEVKEKVQDATNEIIRKNAEMMKIQAVEVVKQNQRTVIDAETLKKSTEDLFATIEGIQKAQNEGAQKRAAAEAEVRRLESQMMTAANGLKDSYQKIVAKELRGVDTTLKLEPVS